MLYLLLAIICSASIALLFKHSETTGMNRYAVTSTNYVTASLVSLLLLYSHPAAPPARRNDPTPVIRPSSTMIALMPPKK